MPDETEDPFADARRLLEEEASRRGLSVADLLDELCRAGRLLNLVDADPQGALSGWAATVARGGAEKTVASQPLSLTLPGRPISVFDGAQGAVILGAASSGKTDTAALTRAQFEAFGLSFREDSTPGGQVEFTVQRPEAER
jgi:hypothetical protein